MIRHPYYIVNVRSAEIDDALNAMIESGSIRISHNHGSLCIVQTACPESKTLFELAFGDVIVREVKE